MFVCLFPPIHHIAVYPPCVALRGNNSDGGMCMRPMSDWGLIRSHKSQGPHSATAYTLAVRNHTHVAKGRCISLPLGECWSSHQMPRVDLNNMQMDFVSIFAIRWLDCSERIPSASFQGGRRCPGKPAPWTLLVLCSILLSLGCLPPSLEDSVVH